jgi:hypothetical protein
MKPRLIPQWKRAWRMFSVQASALVLAWLAIPAEQQAAFAGLIGIEPEVIPGALAALAILGRLIDQPTVREGES